MLVKHCDDTSYPISCGVGRGCRRDVIPSSSKHRCCTGVGWVCSEKVPSASATHIAGRVRLAGELRAEAGRGDRHRGARGGAPRVVELGEVGGQGRVIELLAAAPGARAQRMQDIESDTGYDTRRRAPDGVLARLSQTAVYDTG